MSCEMAALPFQAHANYGTWSIDFVIKDPAEGPGSLFIECNFLI